MSSSPIEPPFICPYCGPSRWQQDEDGRYCATCHEPERTDDDANTE